MHSPKTCIRVALIALYFLCLPTLTKPATAQPAPGASAATPATVGESKPAAAAASNSNSISAASIDSYKECYDPQRNRITYACGAKDCPGGTTYQRTVHQAIPECNSSSCVDMKALGWRYPTNKTKFCRNHGFDGVRPASRHDYGAGGCCFKN
jgi:hypothetical protein